MRVAYLYSGNINQLETAHAYVRASIGPYYLLGQSYGQKLFEELQTIFEPLNNKEYELINFCFSIFVKSEKSLVRSIVRDMNPSLPFSDLTNAKKESVYKETLNGLKDFYRMNFCIKKDEDFERCSIEILQLLRKIKDIKLKEYIDKSKKPYKDTFHNYKNGCKDFKAFLEYKGYPFEIQLHNSSSEDMNLATHGIYEVYRAPDLKEEYKELLGNDRGKLYELVKSPEFSEDRIVKEGLGFYEQ